MRALLEAGADVNAPQEKGFTPLHEAAATGKLDLLRILLSHGANPEQKTEDGKSALDLARDQKQDAIVDVLASVSREH